MLQIHERFKEARLTYNQHGKQTMAEVEKATGISQSLLCDLERDPSEDAEQKRRPRRVGYQTVADLASYYGVSVDWLLSLSEVRSTEATLKAACEYTGLSENAAVFLHSISDYPNGNELLCLISFLLENENHFARFSLPNGYMYDGFDPDYPTPLLLAIMKYFKYRNTGKNKAIIDKEGRLRFFDEFKNKNGDVILPEYGYICDIDGIRLQIEKEEIATALNIARSRFIEQGGSNGND